MASGRVRLLPALMATMAVVLGLKAAAAAEEAGGDHGADAAHAAPATPAPPKDSAGSGAAAPAAPAKAEATTCPAPSFADQAGLSQTEIQVLQSLGERRKTLDARATEIETKAELLTAAEKRVDQRIAELKRIEGEVQALLGKLDETEEARLAGLVQIYQRMRAKDAADIFNGLEDDTLFAVASRMKQANLAEIMGIMDPARARALTRMMARELTPPARTAAAAAPRTP